MAALAAQKNKPELAPAGAYRYKSIYGYTDSGRKKITPDQIGGKYQDTADYICSAYSNPDGSLVPYCVPLDIDVKDGATEKKWLDSEGRLDWERTFSQLQAKYPEVFQFTLFAVRSTGGKGCHLGIAISPFQLHLNDGTRKAKFLAEQLQKSLVRLLRSEGLGADWSALGVCRDLPNWRRILSKDPEKRKQQEKYSSAHQLYFNRFIRDRIKTEKINVLTDLLKVTNKLPGCKVPAKKEQDDVIHVHSKTEPGFAKLYIKLFEELGSSLFFSMSDLRALTGLSKNTLRNVLVAKPESRPKWLKVNYISKSEGYELWLDPAYGSVERAKTLATGGTVAGDSGFLTVLPCPTRVEPGQRNTWIFSAIIHCKWHGLDSYEARESVARQAQLIPTHRDSESYKRLSGMCGQIYSKLPETFGMRAADPLPVVLTAGYFHKVKKQQQPPAPPERSERGAMESQRVAFTRKEGKKVAVWLSDEKVLGQIEVSGSGVVPQLQAVQALIARAERVGEVVIRGNSMLKGHVVTAKFEAFHKIAFKFEERRYQDKQVLKNFRESVPEKDTMATAPRRVNSGGFPRECFSFPDEIKDIKVRLDGHFEYQKAFYWMGEPWIGQRVQVHSQGGKLQVFRDLDLVETFKRLAPGEQSIGQDKGPWKRALEPDSSYRKKARKVGPSFESIIIDEIRKGQGIIRTRIVMAYLSLVGKWRAEDLEAVSSRCLQVGRFHLSYFKSLLEDAGMHHDRGDMEDIKL